MSRIRFITSRKIISSNYFMGRCNMNISKEGRSCRSTMISDNSSTIVINITLGKVGKFRLSI
jgi:hypothetical protein